MNSLLFEVLGWVGTTVTIVSYALMRAGKLSVTGFAYSGANIVGPALIALAALDKGLHSVVVLQVIWGGITLLTCFRTRGQKAKTAPETCP